MWDTGLTDTAAAAERYLRRRRRVVAQIEWVAWAIDRWNVIEANSHLPVALQRDVRQPSASRQTLCELHRLLVDELARLEGEPRPP